jgi:hypothetical protein
MTTTAATSKKQRLTIGSFQTAASAVTLIGAIVAYGFHKEHVRDAENAESVVIAQARLEHFNNASLDAQAASFERGLAYLKCKDTATGDYYLIRQSPSGESARDTLTKGFAQGCIPRMSQN